MRRDPLYATMRGSSMAADADRGRDLTAPRPQGFLVVTDWLVSSLIPVVAPGSPHVWATKCSIELLVRLRRHRGKGKETGRPSLAEISAPNMISWVLTASLM